MRTIAVTAAVALLTGVSVLAQLVPQHQRTQAQQHYRIGEQLMAAEQFANAAEAFGRAVRADRLLAHAHYRQGEAFMALGRFPSAIRAFRACREAYVTLAGIIERERIRALSERRTPAGPLRVPAEVSLALGSAYFRNGQLPDAEREWKAAIAVDPGMGAAHNNLAALYAMTGRQDEAREQIRAAERAGYTVHAQLMQEVGALVTSERTSVP